MISLVCHQHTNSPGHSGRSVILVDSDPEDNSFVYTTVYTTEGPSTVHELDYNSVKALSEFLAAHIATREALKQAEQERDSEQDD